MRIEIWDGVTRRMSIPMWMVPKGAMFRECWETDTEIIVVGWPEDDDESHNCDVMGCSSVSHVLYRFQKTANQSVQPTENHGG